MTNQAYDLPFRSVGRDVVIHPSAKIVNPQVISVGDSVIIDDFTFIMGGERTVLGSFVHIASFSSLLGGGEVVFEDFAGVSSGVRVYSGNDDYTGGGLTNPAVPLRFRNVTRAPVRLCRHVIVGANTVVLPGVTIGEGVAVGANSVVKDDCEPWTIYAGIPARKLGVRPKAKMLELEAQLRAELYDERGQYRPQSARKPP